MKSGAHEQTLPWFKQAVLVVKEQLEKKNPILALCMNNLVLLDNSQGKYSKAEPL